MFSSFWQSFLIRLKNRYKSKELIGFDLACMIGLFAAVHGLDHLSLWVDEAETAFVAKGTLTTGIPLAWDGFQRYPGNNWYYDEFLIWKELPWLQFYITGLSFVFFTPDSWSARLPFVVIGLLALPLAFRLACDMFDRSVARVTVLLLLFSTPYLMHIRQCRYFALLGLGTLVGIWAYRKMKSGSPNAWLYFSITAILLFHSHYAYFFGYMGAWAVWILCFERPDRWKPLVMAAGLIFLGTFPWALYVDLFNKRSAYGGWSIWLSIDNAGYYVRTLHQNVFPFLSVPVILLAARSAERKRLINWLGLALPLILVLYTIVPDRPATLRYIASWLAGLLFVSVSFWGYIRWKGSSTPDDHGPFLIVFMASGILSLAVVIPSSAFRYIFGFLPLMYMLLASLVVSLWRRTKMVGALTTVLLVGTSLFHALPYIPATWLSHEPRIARTLIEIIPEAWTLRLTGGYTSEEINVRLAPALAAMDNALTDHARIRFPLYDYAHEITHPYNGPVEAVIAYLNKNAGANDTFSSDCDAVTLAFSTGLKFKHMDEETLADPPDWISLRPHRFYATHTSEKIRRFYDQRLIPAYEKIELDAPDLDNILYHLPDPDFHCFFPDRDRGDRMVLFRRRAE